LTDPAITGYIIADEQLNRLIVGQTGTLGGTVEGKTGIDETQALKRFGKMMVGPPGLEPAREENPLPQVSQNSFCAFSRGRMRGVKVTHP